MYEEREGIVPDVLKEMLVCVYLKRTSMDAAFLRNTVEKIMWLQVENIGCCLFFSLA